MKVIDNLLNVFQGRINDPIGCQDTKKEALNWAQCHREKIGISR